MIEKVKPLTLTIVILTSTFLIGMSMLSLKPVKAQDSLPNNMPVVFVDPLNATANPGETITIGVKVFNLTNTVYIAGNSPPEPMVWSWGEPLPPPDPSGRFNYSLGNLYGLAVDFIWDANILTYQNHTVHIPVETYSDGILHDPILIVDDTANPDQGTYSISATSLGGEAFNKPDDNATIFEITFTVAKIGRSYLNITLSDLAVGIALPRYKDFFSAIPHWVKNGKFQTTVLATRIESLKAEPLDNGIIFTPPIITGENALIRATIVNDGSITDTYNLTLYWGTTVIGSWLNQTLDPGERIHRNYTIDEAELSIGNHTTKADLSVSHGGFNLTDSLVKQFKVIGPPQLDIIGPNSASAGQTVEFSSSGIHTDPNGHILNYTWTLWAPGETQFRVKIIGDIGTFNLHRSWTGGDWLIILGVKDNFGLEFDPEHPSDRPKLIEYYQTSKILTLQSQAGPGIFDIENIILAVIIIVVIAGAIIYLRRRSR